jgi:hypothetical protein
MPVCSLMCLVSMSDLAKVRLQRSQTWGRRLPATWAGFPAAVTWLPTTSIDRVLCREAMCFERRSATAKIWPHTGQTKTASPDETADSVDSRSPSWRSALIRFPPRFVDRDRPLPRADFFLDEFSDCATEVSISEVKLNPEPRTERSRGESWGVVGTSESRLSRFDGMTWNGLCRSLPRCCRANLSSQLATRSGLR